MELYSPGLVKYHCQISALRCLESVANKNGMYLEKNTTHKKYFNSLDKFSARRIYFLKL